MMQSIQDAIDKGDYYDAYQLYLSKAKKLIKQSRGDEAREIIMEATKRLVSVGHVKSAMDLAENLVNTFGKEWTRECTDCCMQIIALFPGSRDRLVRQFVDKSLEYTKDQTAGFYRELGDALALTHDYWGAVDQYILGDQAVLVGEMLMPIHDRVCLDEFTQLLIYSVLKCLEAKKHQDAYSIVNLFTNEKFYPLVRRIPFASKHHSRRQRHIFFGSTCQLFNFAQLIVYIAQRPTASSLFQTCREQYRGQLNSVNQRMLDQVERVCEFSRQGPGAIMDMLHTLMGEPDSVFPELD